MELVVLLSESSVFRISMYIFSTGRYWIGRAPTQLEVSFVIVLGRGRGRRKRRHGVACALCKVSAFDRLDFPGTKGDFPILGLWGGGEGRFYFF